MRGNAWGGEDLTSVLNAAFTSWKKGRTREACDGEQNERHVPVHGILGTFLCCLACSAPRYKARVSDHD